VLLDVGPVPRVLEEVAPPILLDVGLGVFCAAWIPAIATAMTRIAAIPIPITYDVFMAELREPARKRNPVELQFLLKLGYCSRSGTANSFRRK
jgi:hypothetical protein